MITKEQAALEESIHGQIEAKDANVLCDYAAFVEGEMEAELIRHVVLAILQMDDRVFPFAMAQLGIHSRSLKAALEDIASFTERQRAAFMECSAKSILKELEP